MNKKKTYNNNTLVTVGILKDILGEMVMRPIKEFREEFDDHVESTRRSFVDVNNQLAEIRNDMSDYRQKAAAVSRTQIIHERMIDGLDARVLKLETVK